MAKRNFKMLYASRDRLQTAKTRAYSTMSLDELKQEQRDLEQLQKINFSKTRYDELGAVKTAILRQSPLCVKLPKIQPQEGVSNVTNWRSVRTRED